MGKRSDRHQAPHGAKDWRANGEPRDRSTVGLLQRRHIRIGHTVHAGKESNKLEQVEAGIVSDQDEVYAVYEYRWEDVRFAFEQTLVAELAKQAGLSRMGLYKLRYELNRPRVEHRATLVAVAAEWARQQLGLFDGGLGNTLPTDREVLAVFRHRIGSDERRIDGQRDSARARRARRRELYAAIRALEGIARHRDGALREEYRRIPRSPRSSRDVSPDGMAAMLAEHYPWLNIRGEGVLYAALQIFQMLRCYPGNEEGGSPDGQRIDVSRLSG